MNKLIIALALGAAAVGPAVAADFPTKAPAGIMPVAKPIYDWSGVYIGGNAGGGWSHNCWTQNGYNVPVIQYQDSPFLGISNVNSASEGCHSASGAMAGGQIGARYQVNSFVFGIEAEGDWANLKGSNTSPIFDKINTALGPNGNITLVNTTKTDAIGMFTGQVGYSFGPVLWYAKGGAAVTHNVYSGSLNASFTCGVDCGTLTAGLTDARKETRFGGIVGTGLEWMFAPGWSIGAEYNHLFMGSEQVGMSYTGNSLGGSALPPTIKAGNIVGIPSRAETISQDLDIAKVRLNYTFGAH